MNESQGRRYVVRGRVQGVGFRWWTAREARRLGITGTVRNRSDGTVEIEAVGDAETLRRFGAALEEGPPAARVEGVEVEAAAPSGYRDFQILR